MYRYIKIIVNIFLWMTSKDYIILIIYVPMVFGVCTCYMYLEVGVLRL